MNKDNGLVQRLLDSTWNAYFARVLRFNKDGGSTLGQNWLPEKESNKEIEMIQEELDELLKAFKKLKKVKNNGQVEWLPHENIEEARMDVADAIGDIIYVALGTAGKLGIDICQVLDEIAFSNETKYDENGKLQMIDGKIQKGPLFKNPDLSFVKEPIDFNSILTTKEVNL